MKLRRLAYICSVSVRGHLANPLWRSRLERRRLRGQAIQRAVASYLKPYAAALREVSPDPPSGPSVRRIFSLWLQGEAKAPAVVKACLDSIRAHAQCEVVVLDEQSLSQWISLPEYILSKWKAGKMKAAHFADICRIELLYRYGGVWMDATDYLPAPLPEWLWDADFFVYRSGDIQRGSYSFIQNCFIRASKDAYLLKVWREAVLRYWEQEDSAVDYFIHQLLFRLCVEENPRCAELFAAMPQLSQDPTHLLWYRDADQPFDAARWEEICKGALFQKTDYKSAAARCPKPGSFADHLLRRNERRLFLFASYNPQGVLGETTLWYLKALKQLGDVRFVSDSPLDEKSRVRLEEWACLVSACHHGEYDFGSYKRAFSGVDTSAYDVIYLVNDSVIGPIFDLEDCLLRMERSGRDAFGIVYHPSRRHPHLQSWFIGLRPSVFRSDWFQTFLASVRPVADKNMVCELYEVGLTRLLREHGASIFALFSLTGKSIYNAPLRLYRMGLPFVKKASFTRHGGDMGAQLSKVMDGMDPTLRQAVVEDYERLEGEGFMDRLLSRNPLKMAARYLGYVCRKLTKQQTSYGSVK